MSHSKNICVLCHLPVKQEFATPKKDRLSNAEWYDLVKRLNLKAVRYAFFTIDHFLKPNTTSVRRFCNVIVTRCACIEEKRKFLSIEKLCASMNTLLNETDDHSHLEISFSDFCHPSTNFRKIARIMIDRYCPPAPEFRLPLTPPPGESEARGPYLEPPDSPIPEHPPEPDEEKLLQHLAEKIAESTEKMERYTKASEEATCYQDKYRNLFKAAFHEEKLWHMRRSEELVREGYKPHQ